MLFLIGFMVFWALCGVLAYGIRLADFQHRYPASAREFYRRDCGAAAFSSILGPIGLGLELASTGFAEHGLMYRNPHRGQK
jgi:hypothetical protein